MELKQANEILRKASDFSPRRSSTADGSDGVVYRRTPAVTRGRVDLQATANCTFNVLRDQGAQADPSKLPPRAKRDAALEPEIQCVYDENFRVYGAGKVWRQHKREHWIVARCTVEQLKVKRGLSGVVHGSKQYRATIPCVASARPADLVNRQFQVERPNQLWVADFTYVATWSGLVFVAYVIDLFTRRIVGWRISRSKKAELVLDALEQGFWARGDTEGLTHHSDRDSQYLAIRYTERLAEAGIQCSVGTTGGSYDSAPGRVCHWFV